MFEKLKQFRKRTYGERKRATIIISVSLMLVITFVWGTAILPRMFTSNDQADMRAETVTPFNTLAEDLGIIWGDFQSGMGIVGEMFTDMLGNQEEGVPVDAPASEGVLDIGTRGEVFEDPLTGEPIIDAVPDETGAPSGEADPLTPQNEAIPTQQESF
jgi:hypothetical protein